MNKLDVLSERSLKPVLSMKQIHDIWKHWEPERPDLLVKFGTPKKQDACAA